MKKTPVIYRSEVEPCRQARVGVELARVHAAELYYGYGRSKLKGLGLEYVDFREYSYGDDVRRIDWRLSARSPGEEGYRLYVKEYEEEHIHTVTIAASLSNSMFYKRKPMALAYAASIIALMAARLGDNVILALMGDGVEYRTARDPMSIPYIVKKAICAGPRGDVWSEPLQVAVKAKKGLLAYIIDYDVNPDLIRDSLKLLKSKSIRPLNTIIYERVEVEAPGNGIASLIHPRGSWVYGRIEDIYREIKGHVLRVKAALRAQGISLYLNAGDVENSKARIVRGFMIARSR